jgi:hypothetical protein
MQRVQPAKKQNRFAGTCKPEDNPLLNGVYIWTETKTQVTLSFRYTRITMSISTRMVAMAEPIVEALREMVFLTSCKMKMQGFTIVLNSMRSARVFRIDDADPVKTRAFFEDLWNSSKPAIQTSKMPETTRRRGHTIDEYDVTGSNCTTHSVAGIKYAGSTVFEHGYTSTTTQLPIEAEEDFSRSGIAAKISHREGRRHVLNACR